MSWQRPLGIAEPAPRTAHGLAYDTARQTTVLFGGCDSTTCFADTWAWDGAVWTQLATSGPQARFGHGMAYDEARGRVVVFGGGDTSQELFGDTWEWDGARWTQVAASGPAARWNVAMAYDPVRQRVLLFGGSTPSDVFGDTWEWDGVQWQRLAPPSSPSARVWPAMAYERSRRRMILFGGLDLVAPQIFKNDTWAWDGQSWRELRAARPAFPPFGRYAHAMAWDARRGRVVMFGGSVDLAPISGVYMSDTWEWHDDAWHERVAAPPLPLRAWSPMAYDERRGRTVLFGGNTSTRHFGDTWEYGPDRPGTYVQFGAVCTAGATVPTLSPVAAQAPWLGEPFTALLANLPPGNPAALALGASRIGPLPLAPLGMSGCFLYVAPDLVFPVANPGGVALWTVAIPPWPAFAGGTFFNQGFVADAMSPSGFNVTDAWMGVIGAK